MSDAWRDVALPWGPDIPSFIEPKGDMDVLRTSVLFILLTRLGERVMNPEFGSLIPSAVFEQNDSILQAELGASAQEAITRWDDRVEFVDFSAEIDPLDANALKVKILWKNTKDPLSESIETLNLTLTPGLLGG